MPQFQTRYFGAIDYREAAVLQFPEGLPGFAEEQRFLPVEQPINQPLIFLQSLSRPELCFMTLPVQAAAPGYQLSLAPEDLRTLGLAAERQPVMGDEVLCLAIVSLAEGRPPTANLLAPIVVNLKTRCALQAIQADSDYSHQHPLGGEATCS